MRSPLTACRLRSRRLPRDSLLYDYETEIKPIQYGIWRISASCSASTAFPSASRTLRRQLRQRLRGAHRPRPPFRLRGM
jgi:hypothetical protein